MPHSDSKPRMKKRYEDLKNSHPNRSLIFMNLKFLSKHSPDYSLIPILEWHHNQEEESFIFRFKAGSGRILIAWENSKDGRATYFFIADDNNLEDRLKLI